MTRRKKSFTVPIVAVLVAATATFAVAAGELVKNPLLTLGNNGAPLQWRSEGYNPAPDVTRYGWSLDASGIGNLEISNLQPNDSRWVQKIPVSTDTWYRVSGWIRTENVGTDTMGAYLSVMGTFYNSRDLKGTQPWTPVGFWVKTGGLETNIEIACRLGGYSALNTGNAYFTGLSVQAAGTPKSGEQFVYGGAPEDSSSGRGIGIQVVAVLVAIGLALLVWRYVLPPSSQVPR